MQYRVGTYIHLARDKLVANQKQVERNLSNRVQQTAGYTAGTSPEKDMQRNTMPPSQGCSS